jgi:hypothetical protein
MLGVVALLAATTAIADPGVQTDAAAIAQRGNVAEAGSATGLSGVRLGDEALGAIAGRGGVMFPARPADNVAVILWDEVGTGTPRPSGDGASYGSNTQRLSITLNRVTAVHPR